MFDLEKELQARIAGAKDRRRDSGDLGNSDGRLDELGLLQRQRPNSRESHLFERVRRAADEVRDRLPWRSAETGEPVAMEVVDADVLRVDHVMYPVGTPYVTIGVSSWDAAEAVRLAFEPIAGLDEAAWTLDWARSDKAFRVIRIFPKLSD